VCVALRSDIEENLSALRSRRIKRTTAEDFNFDDFNTLEDVSEHTQHVTHCAYFSHDNDRMV